MSDNIARIALIPAYKPSEMLIDILAQLKSNGFEIITVNDGSGNEYSHIFDKAKQYSTVLEHSVNLGKGAAIKTGLCSIYRSHTGNYVVVTLDADGQHSIEDALRVADAAIDNPEALILGSRAFKGKVPLKSRLGNMITRAVFALTSGKRVSDTQTGLRAFSDKMTARMIDIPGDRYEYEMNVLMNCARAKTQIVEIPIETIYIDGNASSHFHPVRDSYRIYKEILKFSASSLISFGIDYALFCILSALTGAIALSNIGARLVSATVNFEINRRIVFKSKRSVKQSALGYIALAVFILLCNTILLTFLTSALGINTYTAKIMTETAMFILSWAVQRTAIFSDPDQKGDALKMKHKYVWAACYGAVLALFTGYVMLDTFVIPTVSVTDASEINMSMFETTSETVQTSDENEKNVVSSDNSEKNTAKPPERKSNDTENTEKKKPSSTDKNKTEQSPQDDANTTSDTTNSDNKATSSESITAPITSSSSESSETTIPTNDQTTSTSKNASKKPSHSHSSSGKHSTDKTKPSSKSDSTDTTTPVISSESIDGADYSDSNIIIKMSEYYENGTKIYVADVTLSSAQYLKTAFASDSYGKNITAKTSETAAAKNAILAINGDYYGARESGYVIRNGVIYRDTGSADTDVLCIYADGHFEITNSGEKTAQQLLNEGVWQAFSFGPALVENGSVAVGKNDEVGKAMASNPRTAIGIIDNLHYVFVVADGRTSESSGLSLSQLASFMQSLGVKTAYNLDGGGSSTMYFDGKIVNKPTTNGSIKERSVSDIVYIG